MRHAFRFVETRLNEGQMHNYTFDVSEDEISVALTTDEKIDYTVEC